MQFHETGYGRRFFDQQLPMLIDAIRELAAQVGRQNVLLERHIQLMGAQEKIESPTQSHITEDIHEMVRQMVLEDKDFEEKMRLEPGDPVLILSKPDTGYDAVQATVLMNDPATRRVRVRFERDLQLKDCWFVYEAVRIDPSRTRKKI